KELSGDASKVPVLDELVTTGNDTENRNGEDQETSHQHNIDDIADRIEKKLSHELDEIVTLLRDSLKDSIKTELQDQVKKDKENNSDSK
ncbi:MAG: hypothetical protein GTO60_11165, partial [Gammaproteobacteria bacterium]|nr:hypothetical protein [Gammaproteobacteria bacterium]